MRISLIKTWRRTKRKAYLRAPVEGLGQLGKTLREKRGSRQVVQYEAVKALIVMKRNDYFCFDGCSILISKQAVNILYTLVDWGVVDAEL